jgi:hypothetical protein
MPFGHPIACREGIPDDDDVALLQRGAAAPAIPIGFDVKQVDHLVIRI